MALTYKNKPVAFVRCNDEYLDEIKCNNDVIWGATPDEYFEFVDRTDGYGTHFYDITPKDVENMPEFVYIPNTYNGLEVRHIGGFEQCEKIKTVVIPNNIQIIQLRAFEECTNLSQIVLLKGSKLYAIQSSAFEGCSKLKSINLEVAEHLRSIGEFAFANCGFESIFIPEGVRRIEKSAFRWCVGLTNVVMPNTVHYIGNRAFSCCVNLEEIFLSKKVSEIGYGAFAHCHSLTIRSEHENQPKGWDFGWNISWKPIEWGVSDVYDYTLLDDDTYEITVNLVSHLPDKVVIPNAYNGKPVTRIGDWAFYPEWQEEIDLSPYVNVTYVEIPEGVTSIGNNAFRHCTNLKTVIIPNTVTSIGERAFQSCKSLVNVNIPNTVTSIGERAFQSCKNLREITIPDSVITMGNWIFAYCNKITIYCETEERMPEWGASWNASTIFGRCTTEYLVESRTEVNNLIITKYKNGTAKIIGYEDIESNSELVIPSSVDSYQITSIGDYAFAKCSSLTSITIPDSVTSIGYAAFDRCSSLTNITIPDSVTSIGKFAFASCDSLTSVTIGDSVTTISDFAFHCCHSLTSVTIGDSVTFIGDYAFDGCGFSYVTIPTNVTLIGFAAFASCDKLIRVTFGADSKLAFIHRDTFIHCSNLTSIDLPDNISSIGDGAFQNCSNLTSIAIPANVISIGDYAFKDCTNLTYITFADIENSKLQSIGYEAFAGCNISEIELPNGLDSNNVSHHAFDKSIKLRNGANGNALVDLTTGTLLTAFNSTTIPNILTNIGERAFEGMLGIMNLIIPENITTIATEAFLNCLGLREIFIPSSVKYMRANAFKGCTGLTIKCAARKKPDTWDDDWNPDNLSVVWGCVDNTASDELFAYTLLADGTYSIKAKDEVSLPSRLVIPTSYQGIPVTTIAANGFSGREVIWVDVLSGIKTIEYGAFKNCSMLLDINFPETLEYIGADAFYSCTNLELIQLPDSIKTIETWAFRDCDKAKNIYIPNGVEMINNGAFIGVNVDERTIWCENTEAEISAKGWDTAWNAKNITGIGKFPVTYNAAAVTDSSKFEFRTTMDGNYYVKPASTSVAEEMVVVHVPSSYNGIPVTEIGSFAACKNLVKMILPDSITRLRVEAFGGDRYLETSGCTNLNEINLPNSLKWIGDGAFLGSSITKLVIPEGAEQSTLSNVFMNCRQLRHITLPESWTEIGTEMFKGCTNLTDIVLPAKCNYIGSNAFLDCENLQNVYLYNKYWNVGDTVLDLTDKSAAEVAQLLTSAEYRELSWSVVKATAPVLHNEFDEHFVDFTVENPNNTPQVLTVSLTLKDGSGDSIEEVYTYSETYTIGANKSITDAFDMPLTEDYSGLMAFSYAELVAYFENSDEIKLILTNNNEVCEQNGHSYIDTVIAPTCTTRGYTRHECKVCGHTYDDSYVEATGHTYTSNTIAPTCTTRGYTEYTCSVCGHSYVGDYVDALGHTWGDWYVETPATCTTTGWKKRTCSVCGYSVVDFIPTTSHTWVDATCTTPKTCSVCGTAEGYALGHILSDWIIDVEPTDTTDGSKHKECTRCGLVAETTSIQKLGYFTFASLDDGTYSINVADVSNLPSEIEIPSTYNGKAVTVIEDNAFAGAAFTSIIIPSTIKSIGTGAFSNATISSHDIHIPRSVEYIGANAFSGTDTLWVFCEVYEQPDTWDENWATDVHTIKWHFKCLIDGHKNEEIVVIPPTCTKKGYTNHICSVCGRHAYNSDFTDALGHNWSDWSITLEPTCTETGTRRRDCTRCDVYETETIAALGSHTYTSVVTAPTCTEQGYTTHSCSVCGDSYVDTYTDALGHSYGEWTITLEPTCTNTGTRKRSCSRCDVSETETIAALGHISSDWIIDVEATTETEGSKHKECTRCGVVLETATIPKLPSDDEVNYLTNRDGNYLSDNNGNLLIISNGSDGITYLIDEDGNQITDEQGNLLIL